MCRIFLLFSIIISFSFDFYNNLTYFSYKKSKPKNFPPKRYFVLVKAFEIPKDFSRKVLCVRVWGGSPNLQRIRKKHGIAAFFNLSRYVGTAFQTSFLTFLSEKGKPKNFAPKRYFILAKLLRFQRTFHEKSFASGFGADSPNT